eukprot:COSAG01_NODE_57800_length_310_cov_0.540284_1_plen_49_part_01
MLAYRLVGFPVTTVEFHHSHNPPYVPRSHHLLPASGLMVRLQNRSGARY